MISCGSLQRPPMKVTPIGSSLNTKPAGTVTVGYPAIAAGAPLHRRNIEDGRREVQDAFEQASRIADSNTPCTLFEIEKALWTALLKLGYAS